MEIEELKDLFHNKLLKTNALPFLFVGSGFSKRYLKTESWKDLLSKFAIEADCKNINDYISSIENGENRLEEVATLLSKDFRDKWWVLDKYKDSVSKYSSEIKNISSPLKLEISNYLKEIDIEEKISQLDEDLSSEIKLLSDIKIDGLFTTNYDLLLDHIFDNYTTFINQKNILNSRNYAINEMYKIHGCCTDFDNIILTKEDYDKFEKDNLYVIAKLITIFVEHPVIFLGYSLNDRYIRKIITSIMDIVGADNFVKLKDRFIFVSRNLSVTDMSTKDIDIEGKSLTITKIDIPNYLPIFEILANLKRKIPSKFLRHMKEEIYEFSKNSDSKEKFGVIDIEHISDEEYKDIEFVIGVGIKKKFSERGFTCFENADIFERILVEEDDFTKNDYLNLLEITIPMLKRKNNINLPFNIFLDKISKTIDDLSIDDNMKNELKEFNLKNLKDGTASKSVTYNSVKQIIEENSLNTSRKLVEFTALERNSIDIDELKEYLLSVKKECLYGSAGHVKSKFYKAVCLYDRLCCI